MSLEGLIGKRAGSPCVSRRSSDWTKAELAVFSANICEWIMPHLIGRPVSVPISRQQWWGRLDAKAP